MAHVVVIGSVNLDHVARVQRLPRPGETVTDAHLARYPGGKGANQALAARRLGADVSLLACVGDDPAADDALGMLRSEGVNLDRVVVDAQAATGIALVAVADDGDNQIIVAPGANRRLDIDCIELPAADALLCQLEIPVAVLLHAVRRFDGLLCVNLAPARDVPDELLDGAGLLIVNELEAQHYGERLHRCPGLLAVTRGRGGAELWRDGDIVARSRPPAVTAVDTTGAGDTFTAALALSLVEGSEPQQALDFACAAAAASTCRHGAQPAMPRRDEVLTLLAAQAAPSNSSP